MQFEVQDSTTIRVARNVNGKAIPSPPLRFCDVADVSSQKRARKICS
jgi:hypothetical protein